MVNLKLLRGTINIMNEMVFNGTDREFESFMNEYTGMLGELCSVMPEWYHMSGSANIPDEFGPMFSKYVKSVKKHYGHIIGL